MDALNRNRQQGFVIVIALVVMVIMTLASVAMVSSLKGGISASANVAFRQAATRSADVAVDNAYTWVQAQIATTASALNSNIAPANTAAAATTPRYYATMSAADSGCKKDGVADAFTPQSYRFSDTVTGSDGFPCAAKMANKPSGYELYYVIHRMAQNAAAACPAAGCLAPLLTGALQAGNSAGCSMDPGSANFCGSTSTTNQLVYYRITVKVVGPRQNNRYIQGFVY
jgi:type II secretory pathway pseudopilin PulG